MKQKVSMFKSFKDAAKFSLGPTAAKAAAKSVSHNGKAIYGAYLVVSKLFFMTFGLIFKVFKESEKVSGTMWKKPEYEAAYLNNKDMLFVKEKDTVYLWHTVLFSLFCCAIAYGVFGAAVASMNTVMTALVIAFFTGTVHFFALSYFVFMNRHKSLVPYSVFLSRLCRFDKTAFMPELGV